MRGLPLCSIRLSYTIEMKESSWPLADRWNPRKNRKEEWWVGASYTRINPTRRMSHIRRNLVKDFPILKKRRRELHQQGNSALKWFSRLLKERKKEDPTKTNTQIRQRDVPIRLLERLTTLKKKIDRKKYKDRKTGWKVWEEFYPCGGGAG